MTQTFWARTDSNSAKNPSLNLTGDPAVEITFVPDGTNGDLLLEHNGGAPDPDTQVEIAGVQYDFTFELSAALPTLKRDGSQQVPDQFEGSTVYIITVHDYPSPGDVTRLTFMPDETATQTDMNAFGTGAISLQGIDTTTDGVVCFAEGTWLDTPHGAIPVEALRIGDLVTTVDRGPQPILWMSTSRHEWPGSPEKSLPILISRDAFGSGLPSRDLVVSPQHKVLLCNAGNVLREGRDGVLVPARGLTMAPGVRRMSGKRSVTYHHIVMQRHEILISNGLPSESFYPGPMAMRMLNRRERDALCDLIPALRSTGTTGYGPQARPSLTVQETRTLVALARRMGTALESPSTRAHAA